MVCGESYDSPAQLALHCDEEGHGPWNKKRTEPDEEDMEDALEHEEKRVETYLDTEDDILELVSEKNVAERVAERVEERAQKVKGAKKDDEDDDEAAKKVAFAEGEGGDGSDKQKRPEKVDKTGLPPVQFQDVTSAVDVDRVVTVKKIFSEIEMAKQKAERKDRQLADCCPQVTKRRMEQEIILGPDAKAKQAEHSALSHIAQYGLQADGTWEVPDALPTEQDFMDYFRQSELEIVVIVEGVDPVTANTVQKRHSYTVDDVVWGKRPVQCVFRSQLNSAGTMELGGKASAPHSPLLKFPSFIGSDRGEDDANKMGCVIDYGKFHLYEDDDSSPDEFWPVQSR
jgi:hypothetical protein